MTEHDLFAAALQIESPAGIGPPTWTGLWR